MSLKIGKQTRLEGSDFVRSDTRSSGEQLFFLPTPASVSYSKSDSDPIISCFAQKCRVSLISSHWTDSGLHLCSQFTGDSVCRSAALCLFNCGVFGEISQESNLFLFLTLPGAKTDQLSWFVAAGEEHTILFSHAPQASRRLMSGSVCVLTFKSVKTSARCIVRLQLQLQVVFLSLT